ncbi:MAG: ribonuclease HII, partial [Brevundimonas sp.]
MTARAAKPKTPRAFPTMALEAVLIRSVGGPVCGVDEAGRGPWAGP